MMQEYDMADAEGSKASDHHPNQPIGPMHMNQYSEIVLGCKENRQYEMDVKKLFSEIVDRGKGFFETSIEYRRFFGNLTLFYYYYIPYFIHKS